MPMDSFAPRRLAWYLPWCVMLAAVISCDVVRLGAVVSVGAVSLATAASAGRGVVDLAALAARSLPLSRAVLLGSRDPSDESCVRPVLAGSVTDTVPSDLGDIDGGPGTEVAMLLVVGRDAVASAADDLAWHQSRLRSFLDNRRVINAPARASAEEFHEASAAFAAMAASATTFPAGLVTSGWTDESTWPGYCLCRIEEAIGRRDLEALRRWSTELEGATFWLADLHRWLEFLAANFTAALDFQRASPEPFQRADRAVGSYAILHAPSCMPAGMLTQHGRSSFLELERQAEQVFTMPPDRLLEIRADRHRTAESMLVPPVRREAFLAYAAALSPPNRHTLALAARMPYECCFLINMLFRADSAEFVERQCEVLRRFDRLTPNATVEQLMDVLYYRGHSFSAIEWGDHYLTRLLDAAAALDGTPAEAFVAACRWAHDAFTAGGRYGITLTLREALARGTFDCVRATDLAITLFHTSGRSGVGHVRWSCGTDGHSVAACWGGGTGEVLVVDPLGPGEAPGVWPHAYFGGATWPEVLRANPKPYTAELYVRGLDNYVWAAGYVIRGGRAGTLVTAAIPYLGDFPAATTRTIFEGPYPDY